MAPLRTITVYAGTRDFPGEVVAREWFTDSTGIRKGEIVARCPDLQSCRAAIMAIDPGLYCIPRSDGDNPAIVETWI
jgi:hypothetical protein